MSLDEATMHGISKMYVKLFEKFGRMIIANSKNDKERTKMYLHILHLFSFQTPIIIS